MIRIVPYRPIGLEHFTSSLLAYIAPRLRDKISNEEYQGLAKQFERLFTKKNYEPGTEIDFKWEQGGKFRVYVNGNEMGCIISPLFCWAFFDQFLGEQPKDLNMKRTIGAGFKNFMDIK
eukprot:TRINITY_DN11113_c0_g1_i1.p1 TRINITY_DN11113_c0_g1~~TRINITY_DN11113_c0_g1_i1.p1  ORF type:complete len:119 (-),score=17.82 TRINITY_DN11113_c0_g1_i1:11-367(-)